jgi:hypothetical protein
MRPAVAATVLAAALVLATYVDAADRPRYDVPRGYTRCPDAKAWNGFFKWASVRGTTCRHAANFIRATPGRRPPATCRDACTAFAVGSGTGETRTATSTPADIRASAAAS